MAGSAAAVRCTGDGLTRAVLHQPAEFTVEAPHRQDSGPRLAGSSPVSVCIRSLGTRFHAKVVDDGSDGGSSRYKVRFRPTASGRCIISVSLMGKPVPGSPFVCFVTPPLPHAAHCSISYHNSTEDEPWIVTSHKPEQFDVGFRDLFGNTTHAADLDVYAQRYDPASDSQLDASPSVQRHGSPSAGGSPSSPQRTASAEPNKVQSLTEQQPPLRYLSPRGRARSISPRFRVSPRSSRQSHGATSLPLTTVSELQSSTQCGTAASATSAGSPGQCSSAAVAATAPSTAPAGSFATGSGATSNDRYLVQHLSKLLEPLGRHVGPEVAAGTALLRSMNEFENLVVGSKSLPVTQSKEADSERIAHLLPGHVLEFIRLEVVSTPQVQSTTPSSPVKSDSKSEYGSSIRGTIPNKTTSGSSSSGNGAGSDAIDAGGNILVLRACIVLDDASGKGSWRGLYHSQQDWRTNAWRNQRENDLEKTEDPDLHLFRNDEVDPADVEREAEAAAEAGKVATVIQTYGRRYLAKQQAITLRREVKAAARAARRAAKLQKVAAKAQSKKEVNPKALTEGARRRTSKSPVKSMAAGKEAKKEIQQQEQEDIDAKELAKALAKAATFIQALRRKMMAQRQAEAIRREKKAAADAAEAVAAARAAAKADAALCRALVRAGRERKKPSSLPTRISLKLDLRKLKQPSYGWITILTDTDGPHVFKQMGPLPAHVRRQQMSQWERRYAIDSERERSRAKERDEELDTLREESKARTRRPPTMRKLRGEGEAEEERDKDLGESQRGKPDSGFAEASKADAAGADAVPQSNRSMGNGAPISSTPLRLPRAAYLEELEADPEGIGFAYGGMTPGRYARGKPADQHAVHFSIGACGNYYLHVGLRSNSTPLPGSPFKLQVLPGPAHPLSTGILLSDLPLRGYIKHSRQVTTKKSSTAKQSPPAPAPPLQLPRRPTASSIKADIDASFLRKAATTDAPAPAPSFLRRGSSTWTAGPRESGKNSDTDDEGEESKHKPGTESCLLRLHSRDKMGNLCVEGGGSVTCGIVDYDPLQCSCTDVGNGAYELRWWVDKAGSYEIYVKMDGLHVLGSPARMIIELDKETWRRKSGLARREEELASTVVSGVAEALILEELDAALDETAKFEEERIKSAYARKVEKGRKVREKYETEEKEKRQKMKLMKDDEDKRAKLRAEAVARSKKIRAGR